MYLIAPESAVAIMALKLDPKVGEEWATWGIIAIFTMSVLLRFWGLGRFNELIFDEFYYAKFANNYLTNTQFYNSHPPLSQYLIAIGIWIGDLLPIVGLASPLENRDITNTLTGSLHSTFSYRWMNALFGSLIPPLVAALAYQLNRRMSYAFFAALFISLDGLFLVESRYALNNIFLVFFGILGQLLVLIASRINPQRQSLFIISAGISFGASAACKWNGLWFLLGIFILVGIAKIWALIKILIPPRMTSTSLLDAPGERLHQRLASINLLKLIVGLGIVPVLTYSILWIPHLIQNPRLSFWELQLSILNYHEQIGNGEAIHPYCADWYTWPLMLRPLAYYYQEDRATQFYYDVHAMGNPLLWWVALAAIFILSIKIIEGLWRIPMNELNIGSEMSPMERLTQELRYSQVVSRFEIPLFIVVNYAANLLPWILVTRCVFIYHYMGAVLFAILGLAWLVDNWLRSSSKFSQGMGLTAIFAVAMAFVFWLPIYLGLPLDSANLSLRMWNFWIFKWT
jgi:dolichyl-phosphate-mannose-protein mannosyltransferase